MSPYTHIDNSRCSSQRVTGLIVNNAVRPPRKLRREVRAMFHNATHSLNNEDIFAHRLEGYINYFNALGSIKGSDDLAMYRSILERLGKTK